MNKSTYLQIRIDPDLKEKLEELAKGVSMSEYVRQLIQREVQKEHERPS